MTTAPDPLVGASVGRYRIARLVGEGGMGAVYEGVQAASGAAVAIKVLAERYARDSNLIERFFAEARATTAIAHDNIVKVHDLALLPDGRPYIVMELLAGTTLRALVDDHALPIGGVINLVLEVLSALGAAHAAGIVHRDIKPDNVFVTEKGRTKVLDFGIAKLTGANAVARTETGVLLGTPEYMAPEQITEGTVDVRTDIYALGILLFEALTRKRPFDAKSDFELMRAHVSTAPPAPSSLRPDVPASLDDVVRTALAKDPRDRFATTNAMATALRHVATELTVEQWHPLVAGGRLPSPKPPRIPVPIRSSATVRARPLRWFVLALVAAVLVALVWMRDSPARTEAPVIAAATTEPTQPPKVVGVDDEDPPPPLIEMTRTRGPQRLDPERFDWRGYFPTAQALARELAGDASLIMLALDGVLPDGTVDLKRASMGFIFYSFRTHELDTCEIRVTLMPGGPRVTPIDSRGTICDFKPVRMPRCGLAHVRRAANLVDTQGPTQIIWMDKGWYVTNTQPNARYIPDDC